jgi:hypothetical protein
MNEMTIYVGALQHPPTSLRWKIHYYSLHCLAELLLYSAAAPGISSVDSHSWTYQPLSSGARHIYPRQVLILASQSSGTVQMTKEFSDKLGLEIGHETVDAAWHYVRDGTISLFHTIRLGWECSIPSPGYAMMAF